MNDLLLKLPRLFPLISEWVRAQEASILLSGRPLSTIESKLASAVGVTRLDRVRIQVVDVIPGPTDPELATIAAHTGLIGPHTGGITLGHGIYVRNGQLTNRLVSHELRHVYQYESAGSIDAFLQVYLRQIATVGYAHAPLELDAQRFERNAP